MTIKMGEESRAIAIRDGVAYSLMKRIGCRAFRAGVETHGSAAAAFVSAGTADDRAVARHAADELMARADAVSAFVLVLGEPDYPVSLLDLEDPPPLLFALGGLPAAGRPRIGIVGTRQSSAGGERITHAMATALVQAGADVVSGMAFGIDAAAHRGALDAGGRTIAVLGGGADVPYPPSHAALHARIVGHGIALSEAHVGSHPSPGAFPRRNRIIAALCETLVVVEAGERSGALITARIALELGRTVAAVPGPIDSPRHVGSNRLLGDGAAFIGAVEDILAIAELDTPPRRASVPPDTLAPARDQEPAHQAILSAVRAGASDVDGLARSTRMTPRELAGALSALEIMGRLRVSAAGSISVSDMP